MKNIIYISILAVLISCNQNQSKQNDLNLTTTDIETLKPIIENQSADSIISDFTKPYKNELKEIQPDYFELSHKEFEKYQADNSRWFISSLGTDKLYIAPYTDYSLTTSILTNEELNNNEAGLLKAEGIDINNVDKSIIIENIKSKKGVSLGMNPNQVKKIFGDPNETKIVDNREFIQWIFKMKEDNSGEKIGGLKPFVLNGLEFKVEMEFYNNKLTKLIYQYEVP